VQLSRTALFLLVTLGTQACRDAPVCRPTWKTGEHRAYRVTVKHAVKVDAPGSVLAAPLEGALDLMARVHLSATSPTALDVWVTDVENAQWSALGITIPGAAARVGQWRASVTLDERGDAREVLVGSGMERADGAMFRTILLPALAGGAQAETPLGPATGIQEEERRVDGAACERVARTSSVDPSFIPPNLRGTGTRTSQWNTTRRFAGGTLTHHTVDESVQMVDGARAVANGSHVQVWSLVDAPAGLPLPVETVKVEVLPSSAHANALTLRADGMTADMLAADLTAHHQAGVLPQHSRWLWRATGLLELDENAPAKLARACVEGNFATPGMALALDVLAGTGTPAAQHAMITVLSNPRVRERADHPSLLQRAILVEHPVGDLVAMMAAETRTGTAAARRYATSTLGALLWRAPDAVARAHLPVLQERLLSATEEEDARAALMGMANSRRGEYADVVLERARSTSPAVRAAAAFAMGTVPGDAVVDALLRMVETERDPLVRSAVFNAVGARPWAMAAADRLLDSVRRAPELGDAEVEPLLKTTVDTPARQRALLTIVRERAHAGKDAMHRVTEALGRLP